MYILMPPTVFCLAAKKFLCWNMFCIPLQLYKDSLAQPFNSTLQLSAFPCTSTAFKMTLVCYGLFCWWVCTTVFSVSFLVDLPEAEKLALSLCCHKDRPSIWKTVYFECLSSGKHFLEQVLVSVPGLLERCQYWLNYRVWKDLFLLAFQ